MIGHNRETFRSLIERVSGTTTIWATDAQPFIPPGAAVQTGATFNPSATTPTVAGLTGQARITLRILAAPQLGVDERRRAYVASSDKISVNICGLRTYSVSISCTTYASSEKAATILELLRTRLGRPSVRAALRQMNVALVAQHSVLEPADGKTAILDIKLGWGINDMDTTEPGDYISDAPVTGTFP